MSCTAAHTAAGCGMRSFGLKIVSDLTIAAVVVIGLVNIAFERYEAAAVMVLVAIFCVLLRILGLLEARA